MVKGRNYRKTGLVDIFSFQVALLVPNMTKCKIYSQFHNLKLVKAS